MDSELIGGLLSRSELRDLLKKLDFLLSETWVHDLVSRENFQAATGNHDFDWWNAYETPFTFNVWALILNLDMADDLQAAATGDSPVRSQLEYLLFQADSDDSFGMTREPEHVNGIVNLLFAIRYSLDAIAHFGVPMDGLLERAASGDFEALRDAISIDRMAAATTTGSAMISRAQIRGDSANLKMIFSRARPHAKRRVYRILRYATQVLKDLGALDRGITRETVELFERLDVGPKGGEDPKHLLQELIRRFLVEATK